MAVVFNFYPIWKVVRFGFSGLEVCLAMGKVGHTVPITCYLIVKLKKMAVIRF